MFKKILRVFFVFFFSLYNSHWPKSTVVILPKRAKLPPKKHWQKMASCWKMQVILISSFLLKARSEVTHVLIKESRVTVFMSCLCEQNVDYFLDDNLKNSWCFQRIAISIFSALNCWRTLNNMAVLLFIPVCIALVSNIRPQFKETVFFRQRWNYPG